MTASVVDELRLPVWRDKFACAWPEHEHGDAAEHLPLVDVLSAAFDTDAHFACYAHPLARRLNVEAPAALDEPPRMVALVVDVDAHGGGATPAWREQVRRAAERLPGEPFGYFTRGGARIVYRLDEPFPIVDDEAGEAWSRWYLRTLVELACVSTLLGDPACADWPHLFRPPHGTRDGEPQAHGWFRGHPGNVGALPSLDVHPADVLALTASLAARDATWRRKAPRVLPPRPAREPERRTHTGTNDSAASIARAVEKVRAAGTGTRNGTLHAMACRLGAFAATGAVSRSDAERELVRAGVDAGLDKREAERSVRSGLRRGERS